MTKSQGWFIAFVAAGATAIALAGQGANTVQRTITIGRGARVDGVGVCRITPDEIECWDMDGRRDASLQETVTQRLTGTERIDLQLRYGAVNRYLALRVKADGYDVWFRSATMRIPQGPNFVAGASLALVPFAGDPGDVQGSVVATVACWPDSPQVDVPLREGSVVRLEGARLEIGPHKQIDSHGMFFPFYFNQSPAWSVAIGVTPDRNLQQRYSYRLLDRDGNQIVATNHIGEPVETKKYLAWAERLRQEPLAYMDMPYVQASCQQSGPETPGAFTVVTNVNPARIAKLRIYDLKTQVVTITGFPLNPNSSR